PAAAALLRLRREPSQPACIRVVALRAFVERGLRRQLGEGLVATVLDEAHAERPEHRLRRIAHEARTLRAVVARAVPAPRRNVYRVPGLPVVALAVDLGPARSVDDEE